ncbi:acetyl-CoA synthetase [Brevibacterium sanguinis]|uniref:Acetyl-CoA synthetase n=2 Tax=Brevibacterium TaxID=1696 RepID=A0A366ICY5_9MICO|nr:MULTISPECIES: acetate--CoA ligase family protein [Brevibacterium]RBP62415.1 acetyl-CoA synthetase [Brevibacterium sanguinis]RBP68804.1 acetyl-CoA synthetase [Brevibacterium celere]
MMAAPADGAEDRLRRLLSPRSIAVVGGRAAEAALSTCRRMGFDGRMWAVNPHRRTMAGLDCLPDVAALPAPPDAVLLAVPAEDCVDLVAQLEGAGAGGVVCHASGFAEDDGADPGLQSRLVAACGPMPLIGPNCIGMLNFLDGAALWPDEHGGRRVERGVAVITQSGSIGQNISMQRRGLPLAYLLTLGNGAVVSAAEAVAGLLADDRVTAIGLHLETLGDVSELSRVAFLALTRRIPIVALKTGGSALGAQANRSHTSSLSSPDVLVDALFARLGIGRVDDVSAFVETLGLLHVHGGLPRATMSTASCSGGEAALLADVASRRSVALPPLPVPVADRLRGILGEHVAVRNPLDYHTYIWGEEEAQRRCFEEFLTAGSALHLLSLDIPRADRGDPLLWLRTLRAFVSAARTAPGRAGVLSFLPEGLPDDISQQLVDEGIVPLHGLAEALTAVDVAAVIGAAQDAAEVDPPLMPGPRLPSPPPSGSAGGPDRQLDEASAKRLLAAHGLPVPASVLVSSPAEVVDAGPRAEAVAGLRFPVVVKAIWPPRAHKTEHGAVELGLDSPAAAVAAVARMAHLGSLFLIEEMITDGVAELVLDLRDDPQFGPVITIGAGGVHVEVLRDVATVLLPARPAEIEAALRSLRAWPLLDGARGAPPGDVAAVVSAVQALAGLAHGLRGHLGEIEINPLIVRGRATGAPGAVAVDVLATGDLDSPSTRGGVPGKSPAASIEPLGSPL